MTKADKSIALCRDFFPFGEQIPASSTYSGRDQAACYGGSSSNFPQQFTAQERDDESKLDYFGARYYRPLLGRFTSPDAPLVDQFAENPQSWNLFAYVRNNPLSLVDSTGRCVERRDAPDNAICQDNQDLSPSPEIVEFIQKKEERKLEAYQNKYKDPETGAVHLDTPTVGSGHQIRPGDNLEVGNKVTEEQAQQFLEADLVNAGKDVKQLVGNLRLSQREYDALLAFNVGRPGLSEQKSPGLNKAIRSGNYYAISQQLKYTKVGGIGIVLKGLETRSAERQQIFLHGKY